MRYLPKDHELPLLPTRATRLQWWLAEVEFLRSIDHLPPAAFCAAIKARKGDLLGQVCEAAYNVAFDATPAGIAALEALVDRLEADTAPRGPSPYAIGTEMDSLRGADVAPYWRARLNNARALAAEFEQVAA